MQYLVLIQHHLTDVIGGLDPDEGQVPRHGAGASLLIPSVMA